MGTLALALIAGVLVFAAVVTIWRVVIHDRTIARVRFGIFFERERDDDEG